MKTSNAVLTIVIILFITIFVFSWMRSTDEVVYTPSPQTQTVSITGCYAAVTGKDVYTLKIDSHDGPVVAGSLEFKNFQKDSSSGTFVGTYVDDLLFGEYSFQSEGTNSVIQVIFKKIGNDFVRGYGPMDESGTRFADLNNITYDNSSSLAVFTPTSCSDVGIEGTLLVP